MMARLSHCGDGFENFRPTEISKTHWFILFVLTAAVAVGCGSEESSETNQSPDAQDPPEVEILAAPSSLTTETTAQFEFQCLDGRSCEFVCRLNDGDAESCSSSVEYEGLADGEHTFEVIAIDEDELESEPAQWQWTIDTEAPEVIDLVGPPEVTNDDDATFTFACSKDDCTFECQIDDSQMQSCAPGIAYEDLEDGTHEFVVVATDDAGTTSPPATWTWTVDTVAPIIDILDAPPSQTTDDWASFEFECSNKPDCTFECALDYDDGSSSPETGSWESCSSPHIVDQLETGDYTLHIRATDEAGNQGVEDLDWTVFDGQQWAMISTGQGHGCGVRADGTLWCWGQGSHGKLGLGDDLSDRLTPEQVGSDDDWDSVSAGASHTCGLRDDGTLWCWGRGSFGRLGQGDDTSNRHTPEQVESVVDDDDWISVSAGSSHTCGVRNNGTLWCWGSGTDGKLGLGDESHQYMPEPVGGTDWDSISAGSRHTCGVRNDDTLWCWGRGGGGRLGLGHEGSRNTPEQVGADTDWRRVSAANIHTCGVRNDDTLWCWGAGAYGKLGLGDDTSTRLTPHQVGSDTDWDSTSAGSNHTCGVRSDDTLWCWGHGEYGRLGLGDTLDRSTPHPIGGDTDWENVAASNAFTCGVGDDGTLWCWGINGVGQLGLGDDSNRLLPDQVDSDLE